MQNRPTQANESIDPAPQPASANMMVAVGTKVRFVVTVSANAS
ncbi:hypothetical protein [Streptomyces naganishii]|nr:hypothetical protein [Streptomyces naganishii]